MTIELFYEFASTYSYPTVMRAEQLAAERGLTLAYRPILLGPIFAAQGYTTSPFLHYPIKGQYMWRDLERVCTEHGLPWHKPSVFPRRSVLPARIALVGVDAGWVGEFSRRVYQLNFVEDREIDDEETMRALLASMQLDPDDVLARALSASNRARLRSLTERAQALGVFGAPTFVVAGELFWGHDRMQQALAWAERERSA